MAEFLSQRELSDRIGRPIKTLERWRLTGEGPAFVRMGRRVAYRAADVDRWLAARTFAHRAAEIAKGEATA